MKRAVALFLACAILGSGPAFAWGTKTQLSIASTALSLLSRQSNIPLNKLRSEVQEGAGLSAAELQKLCPDFASDPVRAIESEMFLLQAVGTQRMDAYFVYRMGALAKMVSEAVQPLQGADPNYQALYFADVENAIGNVQLDPGKREVVDPRTYFERRGREARTNNDVIVREYQNGVGFKGIAGQQLSRDASRAVASVADVWTTILTGASAKGTVSEAHLQEYVLGAYAFFVKRNNGGEIDAADKRLSTILPKTPDLQVEIGNLYFAGNLFERAMKEYDAVLAVEPNRRDVMEKVSDYYMHLGEQAEQAGKLEDAEEKYAKAAQANRLHPTAEASRIRMAGMIQARQDRQAAMQKALDDAAGIIQLSEQETNSRHYAEAAVLLRQAADTYGTVTDEFGLEHEKAQQGIRLVESRLNEIKGALVDNAQSFSGSGFAAEAKALAQTRGKGLEEQALKAMVQQEYAKELAALQARVEPKLAGK